MTATDELRRMLDKRGVEWETDRSGFRVMWGKPVDEFHDTMQFKAVDNALPNGGLNVHICGFTPEQAIAATLGTAPRLPHFWTHDGVLHVELQKLPESISVRLPDQRDREVGSARVWRYTLDNGTCREVYLLMATDIGDGREEVLGVYATEEAAMAAINENQFGYALHHVRKWEVDA